MNGLELLRAVKEIRPRTDVVMITGFGSKESAIEALNQGAAAYLEKPFDDVRSVEGTLEVLIERQRMRIKQRSYLEIIKERNREFLDRYATIRQRIRGRLDGREPT
jgi:two-component system response regulator HydG